MMITYSLFSVFVLQWLHVRGYLMSSLYGTFIAHAFSAVSSKSRIFDRCRLVAQFKGSETRSLRLSNESLFEFGGNPQLDEKSSHL